MGTVHKGAPARWLQAGPLRAASEAAVRYWGIVSTIGLLAAVLFVIWWAWGKWGREVLQDDSLTVSAKQLVLRPPPPKWIRGDIRAEALRQSSLERLSLLDPEVTVKIRHAFELHPWVASVDYVSKRAGGRIVVELRYRRPILMVVTENGEGWWPVDTMGVLLPPADFSQNDPLNFLQLYTPDHWPAGDVGTSFGHASVVGAARIATLLDPYWRSWGIVAIHAMRKDTSQDSPVTYELETRGGTRIRWGAAPGQEPRGAPTAQAKLARLRQIADAQGTLDLRPSAIIDVRHATARTVRRSAGETHSVSTQGN